jgi:hypothetical protein
VTAKLPRSHTRLWTLIVSVVGGLAAPATDAASGQDVRGSVFAETRVFPNQPLYSAQSDAVLSPSLGLEPELIWWVGDEGPELRVTPMLRLDAHDASRTRFDLREASALWLRDGWTLLAGVSKVYWGTTESVHLVDIINQTDAVENIDGEDKLGQPMINFTLEREWGALDLFVLPFFRERTYPGDEGRLRGAAAVQDNATYESAAGQWHPDFAARWSRAVGGVDLGVGGFYGTSREPYLLPTEVLDGFVLQPYYTIIDQISVDLQYTRGATLWKLEAMTRGGHGDRFLASVFGAEHTLFSVGPGPADLGLLTEITLDGRSDNAPYTPFDNDVFVGARWAFNDIQATSIVGGPIIDLDHGETMAFLEAERRIGERWVGSLELRVLFNTDTSAPLHSLRRDDFLTFSLSRFF